MQRLLNSLGNDHSFSTLEKSYEQSKVREHHMRLEYDNEPLPHMEYVHRRIQGLRGRIEAVKNDILKSFKSLLKDLEKLRDDMRVSVSIH